MKNNTIIAVFLLSTLGLILMTGCENKRKPGRNYMPDMGASRALETFAPLDSTLFTTDKNNPGEKIFYNRKPVEGTIERGELYPYTLPDDSIGYAMSAQVKKPFAALDTVLIAWRLHAYLISIAPICHGAKGTGQWPHQYGGPYWRGRQSYIADLCGDGGWNNVSCYQLWKKPDGQLCATA
jgi:hypothetical protein